MDSLPAGAFSLPGRFLGMSVLPVSVAHLVTDWSRVSSRLRWARGRVPSRLSPSRLFPLVHVLRHLEGQVVMAVITAGTLAADEIRRLPAALTVVQAASLLGIGRSSAYQAVKSGVWPTRVLRIGRTIRIPSADVLALLGIGTDQMRGSQQ
jgi:excisionase family DNA binding protein